MLTISKRLFDVNKKSKSGVCKYLRAIRWSLFLKFQFCYNLSRFRFLKKFRLTEKCSAILHSDSLKWLDFNLIQRRKHDDPKILRVMATLAANVIRHGMKKLNYSRSFSSKCTSHMHNSFHLHSDDELIFRRPPYKLMALVMSIIKPFAMYTNTLYSINICQYEYIPYMRFIFLKIWLYFFI